MDSMSLPKRVEEEILNSYEALYRLAYSYVRNEQDALDIVQEGVYKAIKNAATIKEEAYIKTWLWRIVINTALDYIRKRKEQGSLEHIPEAGKEDKYTDFDTIEALKILGEREKAVIILRFFEDKKLEEISEILQENENTIKTILYRSLKKLKVELSRGETL